MLIGLFFWVKDLSILVCFIGFDVAYKCCVRIELLNCVGMNPVSVDFIGLEYLLV
jgi:hypothetical protein